MQDSESVNVWDVVVRGFHWALVFFFCLSYFTGEEETIIHPWSGYAVIALLMIRIGWGFLGSRHARFSDFIYAPAEIRAYAKGLATGRAKHYLGHNPLGGLAVFALLGSLIMTTFTGMLAYADEEGKGPLAPVFTSQVELSVPGLIGTAYADDDDDYSDHENGKDEEHDESVFEEIHEFFVNLTLLLVLLHVLGVIVESLFHKENLVRSMFNGKKRQ